MSDELGRLADALETARTPEDRGAVLDQIKALGDPDGPPIFRIIWLLSRMTQEQLGRTLRAMEAIQHENADSPESDLQKRLEAAISKYERRR